MPNGDPGCSLEATSDGGRVGAASGAGVVTAVGGRSVASSPGEAAGAGGGGAPLAEPAADPTRRPHPGQNAAPGGIEDAQAEQVIASEITIIPGPGPETGPERISVPRRGFDRRAAWRRVLARRCRGGYASRGRSRPIRSIGSGKTMVEFCSAAISLSVCR